MGPSAARRSVGQQLKILREAAGVKMDEAAGHIRCNPSKVNRMENGRVSQRPRDVNDLLDLYGVTDPHERATLVDMAKLSGEPSWWHIYGRALPNHFVPFVGFEGAARTLYAVEYTLVPGLLQTPEYARALLGAGSVSASSDDDSPFHAAQRRNDNSIETQVQIRMRRQDVFAREDPPVFWAILSESVLMQHIGSPDVMREQLRHLVDVSARPGFNIQVIPFEAGACPGLGQSFTIVDFPDGAGRVVYSETLAGSIYNEGQREMAEYERTLRHLLAMGYDQAESASRIEQILEKI